MGFLAYSVRWPPGEKQTNSGPVDNEEANPGNRITCFYSRFLLRAPYWESLDCHFANHTETITINNLSNFRAYMSISLLRDSRK